MRRQHIVRTASLLIGLGPLPAIAQQVISNGGGHHSNGSAAISYTIGEPIIATAQQGDLVLTQGFHQPWVEIISMIGEPTSTVSGISVYPNPVRHTLHIALDDVAPDRRNSWGPRSAIGPKPRRPTSTPSRTC